MCTKSSRTHECTRIHSTTISTPHINNNKVTHNAIITHRWIPQQGFASCLLTKFETLCHLRHAFYDPSTRDVPLLVECHAAPQPSSQWRARGSSSRRRSPQPRGPLKTERGPGGSGHCQPQQQTPSYPCGHRDCCPCAQGVAVGGRMAAEVEPPQGPLWGPLPGPLAATSNLTNYQTSPQHAACPIPHQKSPPPHQRGPPSTCRRVVRCRGWVALGVGGRPTAAPLLWLLGMRGRRLAQGA